MFFLAWNSLLDSEQVIWIIVIFENAKYSRYLIYNIRWLQNVTRRLCALVSFGNCAWGLWPTDVTSPILLNITTQKNENLGLLTERNQTRFFFLKDRRSRSYMHYAIFGWTWSTFIWNWMSMIRNSLFYCFVAMWMTMGLGKQKP